MNAVMRARKATEDLLPFCKRHAREAFASQRGPQPCAEDSEGGSEGKTIKSIRKE